MENISGFGTVGTLIASNTYPLGIVLTKFADDVDPIDVPSVSIADLTMGVNGDGIAQSKAAALLVNISVIPGTLQDTALSTLLNANRVGIGKISARDVITFTYVLPNSTLNQATFFDGIITDGSFGISISSSGRFKTRVYNFKFARVTGL